MKRNMRKHQRDSKLWGFCLS